jgi:hypothetical protein
MRIRARLRGRCCVWTGGRLPKVAAFAAVSALISIPATLAAVFFYMVIVFHERPTLNLLSAASVWSVAPATRGFFLAAMAGALLCILRMHVRRTQFLLVAVLSAAALGYLLGCWVAGNSPHISSLMASSLFAITWAIAAFAAALICAPPITTARISDHG